MVAFQAILVSFSNKAHCQYWHSYQCFGKNWCLGGVGADWGLEGLEGLDVTFINSEYFILVCQAEVTVALPLFPYRKFI